VVINFNFNFNFNLIYYYYFFSVSMLSFFFFLSVHILYFLFCLWKPLTTSVKSVSSTSADRKIFTPKTEGNLSLSLSGYTAWIMEKQFTWGWMVKHIVCFSKTKMKKLVLIPLKMVSFFYCQPLGVFVLLICGFNLCLKA
jgi:hypothetical protein